MKNVRKIRFLPSASSKAKKEKKDKWIKLEVRAKAVKDHPDLFSLDDEVNQTRKKVRELEKKLEKTPRHGSSRRSHTRDILPMEDDARHDSADYDKPDFELTLSEKSSLRRERFKQVVGTLIFVLLSLAFGLWSLNFLLERIG